MVVDFVFSSRDTWLSILCYSLHMPDAKQLVVSIEVEKGFNLTPRQRKLIPFLMEYEAGNITLTEAMKQAGYADSTAEQQSVTLKNLRENSAMQKALRDAGFNEETIAKKVVDGLESTRPIVIDKEIVDVPDADTQHKYLKTGAELLDAFPAKKNINAEVSIADLIKAQESTTPNGHPES